MVSKNIFIVSLIYSRAKIADSRTSNLLSTILEKIDHDDMLNRTIHRVIIDSRDARNYLRHNEHGVRIRHWPVFLFRSPEHPPTMVPIEDYEYIFELVKEMHKRLEESRKAIKAKMADALFSVDIENDDTDVIISVGTNIKFHWSGHNGIEMIDSNGNYYEEPSATHNFFKIVKPSEPGTYKFKTIKGRTFTVSVH